MRNISASSQARWVQSGGVFAIVFIIALMSATAVASGAIRSVCSNEGSSGFRSYLLDCRAYEMVTPPYKGGFPPVVEGISIDGSQLELHSLGVFSHPQDTGLVGGTYQTARTDRGWESLPFDAPFSEFSRFSVETVSRDFTNSLWFARTSASSALPGVYLGTPPDGPFEYVGPSGPPNAGTAALGLSGTSRDLTHSVYRARAPILSEESPLWPGDKTVGAAQPSLYEYAVKIHNSEHHTEPNPEPRLVGVSNIGPTESVAKSDLISECGTYLGGPSNVYNALSEDGTTVFFTALGRDYPGCAELGSGVVMPAVNELYARLDASQADAHTVAISEPSEADCKKCELLERADAIFEGASFDGSRAFFATTQHLLPGAGSGMELYEYDLDGPAGGRVTLVSGGDPVGAGVQRVVRVSDDGSHIYFLAQGVLTAMANAFGKHAESGAENLYVYEHDGAFPQGHVAFIGQGAVSVAQTTPDGRFLVFTSAADLTPDEEERAEAGQVFEYDAQTGILIRVSRGQNGYNEDGNSEVYPATIPDQTSRVDLPIRKLTRLAMSADGAYVFFTSEDALTLQALSGVMNVYEYHAGQVGLVSDGHDLVSVFGHPAVELLGTDESGRDVFFETADQLVPQDTDTQLDVYDARIEGGFPAAATPPGCSGDSCQGPLASGLPLTASPTSSSGGESAVPTVSGRALKGKRTSKRPKKNVKKHRKAHAHRTKKATGRRR